MVNGMPQSSMVIPVSDAKRQIRHEHDVSQLKDLKTSEGCTLLIGKQKRIPPDLSINP